MTTARLHTLEVYRTSEGWVFDDAERNLVARPFGPGVPQLARVLDARRRLGPSGEMRLTLSAHRFPGWDTALALIRTASGAAWYRLVIRGGEASDWFTPVLRLYFPRLPDPLYIRVDPVRPRGSSHPI